MVAAHGWRFTTSSMSAFGESSVSARRSIAGASSEKAARIRAHSSSAISASYGNVDAG